jgi:hypothetical protein
VTAFFALNLPCRIWRVGAYKCWREIDARVERGVGRGAEAPGRTFRFHGVVLMETLPFLLLTSHYKVKIIVQREAGRVGVEGHWRPLPTYTRTFKFVSDLSGRGVVFYAVQNFKYLAVNTGSQTNIIATNISFSYFSYCCRIWE